MTKQEGIEHLKGLVKPGDTIYTILRHVARSGMSRSISPMVGFHDVSYAVAPLIGASIDQRHYGVKVRGCGTDMGFEVVYLMGRVLWPNGFDCVGDRCPSNDHSNGDTNRKPHLHKDGGYALRQSWL